jgi:DNA-binding NarL/FixJ family response regulator
MNETGINIISEFSLAGHKYSILSVCLKSGCGQSIRQNNLVSFVIVGALRIKNKRYIIAQNSISQNKKVVYDPDNPIEMLTQRELQIVILVAKGKVNKQIAEKLHISEWTVSTHLRHIFAKLGVESRAAMIFRCINILKRIKSNI